MPTSAEHAEKQVIPCVVSQEAALQFNPNIWDSISPVSSGTELLNIHCDIATTKPVLYAWFP